VVRRNATTIKVAAKPDLSDRFSGSCDRMASIPVIMRQGTIITFDIRERRRTESTL
jgi:hypothetical protein